MMKITLLHFFFNEKRKSGTKIGAMKQFCNISVQKKFSEKNFNNYSVTMGVGSLLTSLY